LRRTIPRQAIPTPIAQAILAARAVGNSGVLKSTREMIKGWTSSRKSEDGEQPN
jgi:hypothetical protein